MDRLEVIEGIEEGSEDGIDEEVRVLDFEV